VGIGGEAHLGPAAAVRYLDVAHIAVGDVSRHAHCHPRNLPSRELAPGARQMRDFASGPANASANAVTMATGGGLGPPRRSLAHTRPLAPSLSPLGVVVDRAPGSNAGDSDQ